MLTDRQLLILQVIVDDFIRSAQPVGSRSLSKKEEIHLVQQQFEMKWLILEDLGFIEKTHTSSGRVPSEKGYRYYVDHLLSPQILKTKIQLLNLFMLNEFMSLKRLFKNQQKFYPN